MPMGSSWQPGAVARGCVVLLLSATLLSSCDHEDPTPPSPPSSSTPLPPADSNFDLLSKWAIDRISEVAKLSDSGGENLICSEIALFPVKVSVEPADAIDLNYCSSVRFDRRADGTSIPTVSLQNDNRVPIRLGTNLFFEPAITPGSPFAVTLPEYRTSGRWTINYSVDSQGAAYLLADDIVPKARLFELRSCAADPSVGCLLNQLAKIAPKNLEIRGRSFRLQEVLEFLGKVITVSSVASRWAEMSTKAQNGTIVITSP